MKIIKSFEEFVNESNLNEGTTPQFKKIMKRAKELSIESTSELEDLIGDEFDDEDSPITGADFEIAKNKLKLTERYITKAELLEYTKVKPQIGELVKVKFAGKMDKYAKIKSIDNKYVSAIVPDLEKEMTFKILDLKDGGEWQGVKYYIEKE